MSSGYENNDAGISDESEALNKETSLLIHVRSIICEAAFGHCRIHALNGPDFEAGG